ncbi:MAG TPA: hypothetical protein VFB90_08070 [Dehalococcoidia bacterium]|nr:hypothetical protein [Dehalococcoidia bacterium]
MDNRQIHFWANPDLHQHLQEDLERRHQRKMPEDDAIRFFVWLFWLPVRLITWPFRRGRHE